MRDRPRRARTIRWACVLPALFLTAAATAQQDQPRIDVRKQLQAAARPATMRYVPSAADLAQVAIDPDLERLLTRLGDPVYGVREQAMAALVTGDFTNRQLYAALATRPLAAEQRHRLLTVVQDRLLNTPRGAVGIKVDQRFMPERIVVLELLPDLPARHVLEVGDRITHLDGVPLDGWQEFVDAVQSERPGTKITVSVERPVSGERHRNELDDKAPKFEMLQIEIELGSTEMLTDPQTGRPQRGGLVWDRRKREAEDAARVWGPQPKPLEIEDG